MEVRMQGLKLKENNRKTPALITQFYAVKDNAETTE